MQKSVHRVRDLWSFLRASSLGLAPTFDSVDHSVFAPVPFLISWRRHALLWVRVSDVLGRVRQSPSPGRAVFPRLLFVLLALTTHLLCPSTDLGPVPRSLLKFALEFLLTTSKLSSQCRRVSVSPLGSGLGSAHGCYLGLSPSHSFP